MQEIGSAVPTVNAGKLRVLFTVLKQEGLLVERRQSRFELRPRLFSEALEPLGDAYEQRRERDRAKLEQMVIQFRLKSGGFKSADLIAATGMP